MEKKLNVNIELCGVAQGPVGVNVGRGQVENNRLHRRRNFGLW